MDDMDEVRTAPGTAADFSAWNVENKFGKMKVTSKEKVIEPVETEQPQPEGFIDKSKQRAERMKELEEEQARLKAEEEAEKKAEELKNEKRQRPGSNIFNINANSLEEVKEMAKKLVPTVDKIKPEEYPIACELAINLALTFEGVWNEKINLGGQSEQKEQQ